MDHGGIWFVRDRETKVQMYDINKTDETLSMVDAMSMDQSPFYQSIKIHSLFSPITVAHIAFLGWGLVGFFLNIFVVL